MNSNHNQRKVGLGFRIMKDVFNQEEGRLGSMKEGVNAVFLPRKMKGFRFDEGDEQCQWVKVCLLRRPGSRKVWMKKKGII